MVELKGEGVLISSLKFHGKSYAMIGESNWRPKTIPKNKLRLNLKKLLNPKLAKENITVIDSEDSSSQENLKEDEDLSEQVDNKREDSVIENPSLVKDTVKEQSKDFSFKGDKSQKVPVVETKQHEEDDEEILILNFPWLSEEVSSFQEGKFIDSQNENMQKTVKQYKYQIDFLNETNEGLVM